MLWKIVKIGTSPAISFAAEELKKYLTRMDPSQEYALLCFPAYDPDYPGVLWVGRSDAFDYGCNLPFHMNFLR